MALNRRSQLITAGVARSPNRAMLRAVGFGDGDFVKPIVGVANGHSNMNPCNAGIQPLVDRAMAALRQEGAMPQVFGVPTITDGIGMGTEAMKYSLVSREVIADAIETSVNGQAMDGVLAVGGCDKNMPGCMIAMARMNVPAIYVYGGTIKPGFLNGEKLDIEGVSLGVIYTPGHTDDSYSFTMADRVFTGDTLLIRGTGRTDFQNGDSRTQYDSIFNRLLRLPEDTLVFPAHDYKGDTVSTIAEERAHNPRLQVASRQAYVEAIRVNPSISKITLFTLFRRLRNRRPKLGG